MLLHHGWRHITLCRGLGHHLLWLVGVIIAHSLLVRVEGGVSAAGVVDTHAVSSVLHVVGSILMRRVRSPLVHAAGLLAAVEAALAEGRVLDLL